MPFFRQVNNISDPSTDVYARWMFFLGLKNVEIDVEPLFMRPKG